MLLKPSKAPFAFSNAMEDIIKLKNLRVYLKILVIKYLQGVYNN